MARPAFRPTADQRRRVEIAAGAGMAHNAIATALGVSRNTLEKHFRAELSSGAIRRRAEIVEAIYRRAKRGNVAAMKHFLGGKLR